ncbi:MAG: hypothetical protein AAFY88_02490 [Acidobacteriota bacterium]
MKPGRRRALPPATPLLALALLAPSAASAGVAAQPDVVYVIAGETTAIPHIQLTAND